MIHPPLHRNWLFITFFTLLASTSVPAQPLRDAEPLDPAIIIEALREAYRAAPFAEEVTARVRVSGRLRIDRIDIRADPRPDTPRLRLTLGDLDIAVTNQRLIAANRRDAATFVARDLPEGPLSTSVAAILPPVPLPQIELAFGEDPAFANPLPYLRDIRWISASQERGRAAAIDPSFTVIGQGPLGQVTLVIDQRTSRLRALTATIARDEASPTLDIELRCQPVSTPPPGDHDSWTIDTTDRRELPSLTDLRPAPRRLRPGDPVPDPSTYTTTMDVGTLLAPLTDHANEHAPTLILILYLMPRAGENPIPIETAARHALHAAHDAAVTRLPHTTILSPVAVFGLSVFDPEAVRALGQRWSPVIDAQEHVPGVDVLPIRWTGFARDALLAHDPRARLVIACVAHDLTLLASAVLNPEADSETIRREVLATIPP